MRKNLSLCGVHSNELFQQLCSVPSQEALWAATTRRTESKPETAQIEARFTLFSLKKNLTKNSFNLVFFLSLIAKNVVEGLFSAIYLTMRQALVQNS